MLLTVVCGMYRCGTCLIVSAGIVVVAVSLAHYRCLSPLRPIPSTRTILITTMPSVVLYCCARE